MKHDLVRNAVLSAVRKTAPLFTAEEAKVTKIAEFRRLAEDQLIDGEYLTMIQTLQEKAGEDEVDAEGNVIKKAEVQEYKVTQLKLDSNGNRILTKPSALKQYGIKVLQFEIQNVKLDEKAQKQLDIVKEREMQRVANATAAKADRKSRMRINYLRWRDKHIEEIRLKARLRYHKNHPGSKKYEKCWNKKEND